MNRVSRFCFLLLLPIWCCTGYLSQHQKVDHMFRDYQGAVPGAAVMVIHKGQALVDTSYGLANLAEQIRVTPATNFRLASVSKQFTAMCIMILKERGELTLATTLNQIFPDFPEYGKQITVEHLLRHTSGLVAYENLIPDTASVQVLDRDVLRMMMTQDSTYFNPGSSYRYSNSGYAVLAMIVEKLSGKSFAEFLCEEIFIPLGMNHTVAFENGISEVSNRAYGYTVNSDSIQLSDQSITSAVLGDGGIYSSIRDLFKWDQALYTGKLVKKATLDSILTPGLENYGLGWRIDDYKGHLRIHHTGSTRGFRTVIQRFPEDEFTVIVLTNRSDPGVAPLADRLAAFYLVD